LSASALARAQQDWNCNKQAQLRRASSSKPDATAFFKVDRD
jgi:hypothetical protein